MNSRSASSRLVGKRASAIALLAATLTVGASLVAATPAAAAVTPDDSVSIAAADNATNQQAGLAATATLHVNYTQAPGAVTAPGIDYTFVSPAPGTPTPTFPAGGHCGIPGGGMATCTIPDPGGLPGTFGVEVFADNNANDTYGAGDVISGTATVIFSGVPAVGHVTLTPATSSETNGTCVPFKATVTDSLGQPAVSRPFTLSVTENSTTRPDSFAFFHADCTTSAGAPTETFTSTSVTDTIPVTTGADGTFTIGIASSAVVPARVGTGPVTVTSVEVPTVSATSTATWTAGSGHAVASLTVSPTALQQYINTTATFAVTALDQFGGPVQGATVSEEATDGPEGPISPAPPTVTSCGVTNASGIANCTIANGGTEGTDSLTFWVDNGLTTPPLQHTTGPDPDEPQVRATVKFNFQPTATDKTLTCVDQLVADKGAPAAHCTVPTTQTSVTFTETLTNTSPLDGTVTPVPGAVVTFTPTAAVFGGAPATLPSGTATTDAHGVATFTVTDPNPANNDTVSVSTSAGSTALNTASAQWKAPTAGAVTLTPPLQTVTKGGVVGVVAQVADQFGTPVAGVHGLFYSVSGSDAATGNITTNASGSASISYTTSAAATTPDTIHVTDTTDNLTSTATVVLVAGSPTASNVTVDTTGNGTPAICPTTIGTPHNTNLLPGSDTNVCVLVKNTTGEALAGKTVTFTVSSGQVDAGNPKSTSTTSYVATTNQVGIAVVTVSSTTTGTQTVTATSDGASGTGTLTYAAVAGGQARTIKVTPSNVSLTDGNQQKFTWTVADQFGNPVGGVQLVYVQSGAGTIAGGSSGLLVTASDGTASVVVVTSSADNGAGSVTATIQQPASPAPLNQCNDAANNPVGAAAGNCVASATYTVLGASRPASVALHVLKGVVAGSHETVTATVKNANGTPSVNQVIRFLVTGANGLIGSARTNSAGVATFSYLASHAGVDAITAFDDINNDQAQQGNEPGHHTKATIHGVTDRPTIHLTSTHGEVTIHVSTHPQMPRVLVTYYVKRYGFFRKIGTSRAGTLGHASATFFFPEGVTRKFKARVNTKQGIVGAKTVVKTITVR